MALTNAESIWPTCYEDFALSPTRFHWQSCGTTGDNSPTGKPKFSELSDVCEKLRE